MNAVEQKHVPSLWTSPPSSHLSSVKCPRLRQVMFTPTALLLGLYSQLLWCTVRPYLNAEDRFKQLSTNCTQGLKQPLFLQVTVPPFAGPLFRRQQEADKEKRSGPQNGTGRRYAIKELKETEKTSLCAKLPPFPFPVRSRPPGERRKTSPRSMRPGTHSACSPENFTCAVKKHLSGEEMTSDPSRIVFERQFWSSRLSRENPGAAKKVLRFQQQRPRSWAAGDHRQRRGPVERKVMTAEVLGKHLASLQEAARPPSAYLS
ncbi:protein FAM228A-like isoform 2-T2 [Erethizon dorsatum]